MKRFSFNALVACLLAFGFTAMALAGQPVEIQLKDGSRWRGETADTVELRYLQQGVEVPLQGQLVKVEPLYIVVEGHVAGSKRKVTVFRSDIVSMKTLNAADNSAEPSGDPSKSKPTSNTNRTSVTRATGDTSIPGVFVLPLSGMVGLEFRHEEIKALGDYIDKNYGPGQIIVLHINTDGGSSPETTRIGKVIGDLRMRHRVIAWIEKAISAGCQTAMYCDEIYFMTQGTAGAVTTWNMGTGQAVRGELLEKILEEFVRIAEENGYSRHLALSMKMNEYMCSYDKDPLTGEVTFYGDLSGQYILSDSNSNLVLTSSGAEHCRFSAGTADTPQELAKLLNMEKWNEIDDYGRRLSRDWQRLCEQAASEIPLLFARYNYKGTGTGDAQVVVGTRIRIIQDLIRWWDRCHNFCYFNGVPPKEILERELAELRKQLSDLQRRR